MSERSDPIHALITWVDGNDLEEQERRKHHLAKAEQPLNENATNPHRWTDNEEINFCLRSIHQNAPWIEKIWILVSAKGPQLSSLPAALQRKIEIAYHRDVFGEFSDSLPTFNSVAIESLMWRIEGLSESFIYFNDDVFLINPTSETDFFKGSIPILRGEWQDFSHFEGDADLRTHPAYFNHYMVLHAAKMMGYAAENIFENAHVAHPLKRSVMSEVFQKFPSQFEANASCRFRMIDQFQPIALHNHALLQRNEAQTMKSTDAFHLESGQTNDLTVAETQAIMDTAFSGDVKQLCVNDITQVEDTFPKIRELIEAAVSGN